MLPRWKCWSEMLLFLNITLMRDEKDKVGVRSNFLRQINCSWIGSIITRSYRRTLPGKINCSQNTSFEKQEEKAGNYWDKEKVRVENWNRGQDRSSNAERTALLEQQRSTQRCSRRSLTKLTIEYWISPPFPPPMTWSFDGSKVSRVGVKGHNWLLSIE